MYTLKNKEVFWDFALCEKNNGITIKNHRPVRKNTVISLNKPWEGEHGGYHSLVKIGDTYRIYYRAAGYNAGPEQVESGYHSMFCVAESTDGKTFTRPKLGLFEYNGSKDNNIIFAVEGKNVDNFSVYYDENPDCPADAKFKALTSTAPNGAKFKLAYYKSADGYKFEYIDVLPIEGAFDSLNLTIWVSEKNKYRIYFRNFHTIDGADIPVGNHDDTSIRDIRYVESEDFVSWTEPKRIAFTDGKENIQYYTSGITKYPDTDMYFGVPVRYVDRVNDAVNYKHLPKLDGFRERLIKREGRGGTAVTDCTLIFSRDGYTFERSGEAFCTPGIENNENWIYGDCYFARGLFETESDFPYEPSELSFYKSHGYRHRPVDIVRFTLRRDGFRSWHTDANEGYILTKPVTIDGEEITVNFATSAFGCLNIIICDLDGNPIDGYDSTNLFGDSVCRPVEFEKPISALHGTEVRLKISMCECDLYSVTVK
ncbi:MAG: hypothetical protein IKU43_02985 [Clostridia bacterium]|nr:hypothetical protein [Clostridia bacterium]